MEVSEIIQIIVWLIGLFLALVWIILPFKIINGLAHHRAGLEAVVSGLKKAISIQEAQQKLLAEILEKRSPCKKSEITPPDLPTLYYTTMADVPIGPFPIEKIREMILSNKITINSPACRVGSEEWLTCRDFLESA